MESRRASAALRLLVVNAGSSSLKLALLEGDREEPAWAVEAEPGRLPEDLAARAGELDAVGHRIVHGGQRFRDAVRVDATVRRELEDLVDLAPLHQPKSLHALDEVSRVLPDVPAVACFDTAFHASLPPAAYEYALPAAWRRRWTLRRYGFHGLSHAWVARRVPEMLGPDMLAPQPAGAGAPPLRIVSCHLGSGASLCAIEGGRSVDTTMGFTPLEGLVMGTRSGSVDPGLLLWVLERTGTSEREMAAALEHESGLLGLAGTADMREVLASAQAGDELAARALDVYLHRLRAGVAAMAAAMGGIDVLAFTGGVGEHSEEIRRRAVAGLEFLLGDRVPVLVVPTREDLEIARQVAALLAVS